MRCANALPAHAQGRAWIYYTFGLDKQIKPLHVHLQLYI